MYVCMCATRERVSCVCERDCMNMCVWKVCVYDCVCEKETQRQRQRERDRERKKKEREIKKREKECVSVSCKLERL